MVAAVASSPPATDRPAWAPVPNAPTSPSVARPAAAVAAHVVAADVEGVGLVRYELTVVGRNLRDGDGITIEVSAAVEPAAPDRMKADLLAAIREEVATHLDGAQADRIAVVLI